MPQSKIITVTMAAKILRYPSWLTARMISPSAVRYMQIPKMTILNRIVTPAAEANLRAMSGWNYTPEGQHCICAARMGIEAKFDLVIHAMTSFL